MWNGRVLFFDLEFLKKEGVLIIAIFEAEKGYSVFEMVTIKTNNVTVLIIMAYCLFIDEMLVLGS